MDIDELKNMTCEYSGTEHGMVCTENGIKSVTQYGLWHGFVVIAGKYNHKVFRIIYVSNSNDTLQPESKFGLALIDKFGKPYSTTDNRWDWFKLDSDFKFYAHCTDNNYVKPICSIMAYSDIEFEQEINAEREKQKEAV